MNELSTKTVKELRDVAKGLNIKGRWDMNKHELIEAINKVADLSDKNVTYETNNNIKEEIPNQSEGSQKVTKTTIDYLNEIEVGTLVAFKRNKNKDIAMSGKFVKFDDDKVVVESKQGTLFKLNKDCIIWVKTGLRWPKWVFTLFNKQKQEVDDDAIS